MAAEGDSEGEAAMVATYVAEDNTCFTSVNGKVLVSSRKTEAMARGCRPKDKGVDVLLVV